MAHLELSIPWHGSTKQPHRPTYLKFENRSRAHAHTRTLLRRSRSVGGAPHEGDPTNQLPCALRVYSPVDSHTCQTPWSVFQDGPNGVPAGRCQERAGAEARRDGARCQPRSTQRHLHRHINSLGFGRRTNPHRSTPRVDRRTDFHRSTSDRDASPAPIRFPPDNFKHSLTLFSKSFSSFPRGTCLLSVSRQYLALDGIYRPIGAAFPNNPTRRQRLVVQQGPGTTGLSPSPAPPSRGLGPGPSLRTLLQTTIRTTTPPDFQAGLIPVRSPLLRESLQIAPPTKNGHAPPPIESRKSSQSVNPYYVWTWINQTKSDIDRSRQYHILGRQHRKPKIRLGNISLSSQLRSSDWPPHVAAGIKSLLGHKMYDVGRFQGMGPYHKATTHGLIARHQVARCGALTRHQASFLVVGAVHESTCEKTKSRASFVGNLGLWGTWFSEFSGQRGCFRSQRARNQVVRAVWLVIGAEGGLVSRQPPGRWALLALAKALWLPDPLPLLYIHSEKKAK
ncbi:hypothetical protein L1987_25546 [Smallanthus sonchifolius]|uniref:Uncharacterized protein n=1 Tax=Smallanthus sonchifolius TaxID=185202 RepID=A0ACB9IPW3_9ASTR|nr:hypothetical protein L1987_25546 [Smallanthus sonchifolius]